MKIAVGNSRMDKKWKNQDVSWADLCARCSSTICTTETVEEYRKLKKGQQDVIKDVGGFVGGHLREGRRKSGMVACRSLLTLDMDYGTPDIWDKIVMLHDFKCCVYSTHKHTPEHPRLRLLLPLTREVSEDEYPAVARMVAKEIGIDLFDDTTYEPARLMYWPSTSANGEGLRLLNTTTVSTNASGNARFSCTGALPERVCAPRMLQSIALTPRPSPSPAESRPLTGASYQPAAFGAGMSNEIRGASVSGASTV